MRSCVPGSVVHDDRCGCLAALGQMSRRGFLGAGLGAAGALALGGGAAEAKYGKYELMVLSCIDPRLVTDVHDYMGAQRLRGQFSQFVIAGGPIGVVAPAFAKWQPAFWYNLAATIQLHSITRVFGLTHRDCGAAKIAYGEAAVATPDAEEATHRRALAQFAAAVKKKQPKLGVTTGIMALNGSVEMIEVKAA
jgi:hypothetical protein